MSIQTKFVCLTSQNQLRTIAPLTTEQLHQRHDLLGVLGGGTTNMLGSMLALDTPAPNAPKSGTTLLNLTIRLRIIYAADDHGKDEGVPAPTKETLTPKFTALVNGILNDWAGTGISFLFFPDRDLEVRNDSKLNYDYSFPANVLAKLPADEAVFTQQQIDTLKNECRNDDYRNKVAAERPNTLFIVIGQTNDIALEEVTVSGNKTKQWIYNAKGGGNHSGSTVDYVVLNKYIFGGTPEHEHHDASRAGHEFGHYFYLWHTFREDKQQHNEALVSPDPIPKEPKARLDRWTKALASWIDKNIAAKSSPAQALQLYDSDPPSGVKDTPADPGAGLLGVANLVANGIEDPLGPTSAVSVYPAHVSGAVIFRPDRGNPMSYYLDGKGDEPMHFSADQIAVMRASLIDHSRHGLVGAQLGDTAEPHVRICAVWSPGNYNQRYEIRLTRDSLSASHDKWTASGFHLSSQCAYVDNGIVLYDAVWDEGARKQHVIWGWLDADVETEVSKWRQQGFEASRVQAYRHPGTGLRYNAIFEKTGDLHPILLGKTDAEVNQVWNALMPTGLRLVSLDAALNENGQIRHAAVFAPGLQNQHCSPQAALADISADYKNQWDQSRRLSSLAVVWTSSGPQYSGVWGPDMQNQYVMWLHVRERILEVYDEMWWQGFRLRTVYTTTV